MIYRANSRLVRRVLQLEAGKIEARTGQSAISVVEKLLFGDFGERARSHCRSPHPVLLNRTLLLKQSLTLLWVTVAFIWIYRTRRSGETASLTVPATRLLTSFLLALLIPSGGDVPFGAGLVAIPHLLAPVGDFVLIPTIIVILMFVACVLIIFGLLSAAVKLVTT